MEKSVSFLELVSTGSCRTGSFNTKGQRKYCHSHRWVAIVSSQKNVHTLSGHFLLP